MLNVEYQGKLNDGLHNPHVLVVSNEKTVFSGLGTPSFIKSRGISEENAVIVPNTFKLHKIVDSYTSGGSIEQGTYFVIELKSTTTEHTIRVTLSASTIMEDLFKNSVLKDGKDYIESDVYSIVTHNASYKMIKHNSNKYESYVSQWETFVETKEVKKEKKSNSTKKAVSTFTKGNIYLRVHKPLRNKDFTYITKYVYLGQDILPTPYIKKTSYIAKGGKRHIFVALDTVHYLAKNTEVEEIINRVRNGMCNVEDLVNIQSNEDKYKPHVITQPYVNYWLGNNDIPLENTFEQDSILSPFVIKNDVILAYTNEELVKNMQSDNEKLYPQAMSMTETEVTQFADSLKEFVIELFEEEQLYKYSILNKSKYYVYDLAYADYVSPRKPSYGSFTRRNSFEAPLAYYTELYRYFLKDNLSLPFPKLVQHSLTLPLNIATAKNVSANKRVPNSSHSVEFNASNEKITAICRYFDLTYYSNTPIEITKKLFYK